MGKISLWEEVLSWLAHLPIRFAFRLVWLTAKLGSHNARAVHRAMWNANLNVPPLKAIRSIDKDKDRG